MPRPILSAAVLAASLLPACGDAPAVHAVELPPPPAPSTAPAATPAWFTDVTAASELRFTHVEGDEQWDIRPTMGPGLAWSDVQADGWQDLYVVGGSAQDGVLFVSHGRGNQKHGCEDDDARQQDGGCGQAR